MLSFREIQRPEHRHGSCLLGHLYALLTEQNSYHSSEKLQKSIKPTILFVNMERHVLLYYYNSENNK